MVLQSTFITDLKKEQQLTVLIDKYYKMHLKHYTYKRIEDKKSQLAGVDVLFIHKHTGRRFMIDEKAQLDYVNEDLPTFAFEINYYLKEQNKTGWFFDRNKKTQFYALITAIYSDEPNRYTSCKITLVNREKLIRHLKKRNINQKTLENYTNQQELVHGKIPIKELHPRKEGYLFVSKNNKAEQPTNLILKFDFLLENGIAKRLV